MTNWENKEVDIRTDEIAFTMRRKDVMRMVALKVLQQNDIDVFVNPPTLALPGKIGQPAGGGGGGGGAGHGYGARLGIPEVFVPAGFATEVYDPVFALNKDGTEYESKPGTTPTQARQPAAVQHRLLGRPRRRGDRAQSRVRLRERDTPSQAARGIRTAAGGAANVGSLKR